MSKVENKENILQVAREKLVTYKGTLTRLIADFSAEIVQTRREEHNIFKVLKEKKKTKTKKKPAIKNTLPGKFVLQNQRKDKVFQTGQS